MRRTVGPGRRWRTGYDADGILIENADATTVLAYHTVRGIAPFGPVVAFIRERLAATASPH
ncbi:MAG: hypothetical protein WCE30_16555 [Mycobacterium sp.]